MSSGPRIVFTRFLSMESPKLVPWVAHVRDVIGTGDAPVEAGENAVVWQLVSANNRHLARSVAIHSGFEDAAASARQIIAASDGLVVELVSQPVRGSYGWFAATEGVPVMLCSRWYVTVRDRRHAIALALRSLAEAQLHEGVRLIHPAPREAEPFLA